MGFRIRRAAWALASVFAFLVAVQVHHDLPALLASDTLPSLGGFDGTPCKNVRSKLVFDPDQLMIVGDWSADLPANESSPESIRFLLPDSFTIDSVMVGKRSYEEQTAGLTAVFRSGRDLRHYAAELSEESGIGRLRIQYRGPAVGVSATQPGRPLPLVFLEDSQCVPVVDPSIKSFEQEVWVPRDEESSWTVFPLPEEVDQPDPAWRLFRGKGPFRGWAAGPLRSETLELDSCRLEVASTSSLPEHLLTEAVGIVAEALPGWLPPQLHLLLAPNLDASLPVSPRPGFWFAPAPDQIYEMVRCLTMAALQDREQPLPPELSCLPEIVALLSVPEADSELRRMAQADLRRSASDARVLNGWIAVKQVHGSATLRAAIRDAASSEGGVRPVFADTGTKRLYRWISGKTPDLVLGPVRARPQEDRYELRAQVRLDPPPGNGFPIADVDLWIVYEARTRKETLKFSQGVAVFEQKDLFEEPLRLIVDPEEQFPDSDRSNNVETFLFSPEPETFAVTEDSSLLALWDERWDGMLQLFDLSPEATDRQAPPIRDSFDIDGEIVSLRWISARRHLLVGVIDDEGKRVDQLLDVEDGRLRSFPQGAMAAPGGHHLLFRRGRPDSPNHRLYNIRGRRESPCQMERSGPLRWVAGADYLIGGHNGTTEIRSLDGQTRGQLPLAAVDLRDAAFHASLGFTFVTESAQGSRLRLSDGSGVKDLFQAEGRIQGYFLSPDSAHFYVFVETSERDHRVVSFRINGEPFELYRGKARPLASLHSFKGAVLSQQSGNLGDGVTGQLLFHSYESREREEGQARMLSEEAYLSPEPVLASAGRYLYYVRAEGGARGVPSRYRRRALYRYDFLTALEEPIFP